MDENLYNFIKRTHRPPSSNNSYRPILTKIQNFVRPTVRPSTVSMERPTVSTERATRKCVWRLRETKDSREIQKTPQKDKQKPIMLFRKSKSKNRNVEPVAKKALCKPETEDFYLPTQTEKEQSAMDDLCQLSLLEAQKQQTQNFLSGWVSSYPVRTSDQKRAKINFVNRSSTAAETHRYRRGLVPETKTAFKDSEVVWTRDYTHEEKAQFTCETPTPADMRRANSERQPAAPIEPKTDNFNDGKIFLQNGLLQHLRRKQQMGRLIINEQWLQNQSSLLLRSRNN